MHHINIYFYQIDFLVFISDFKKNDFLDLAPHFYREPLVWIANFLYNASEMLSHYSFKSKYDLEIIEMEWKALFNSNVYALVSKFWLHKSNFILTNTLLFYDSLYDETFVFLVFRFKSLIRSNIELLKLFLYANEIIIQKEKPTWTAIIKREYFISIFSSLPFTLQKKRRKIIADTMKNKSNLRTSK